MSSNGYDAIVDYDVVDLTELLVSSASDISLLEVLTATANDQRVIDVGSFTDEEMAIVSGEVDEQLSPWLAGLTETQRAIALREARRNLAAEQVASFGQDGELLDVAPAITTMMWARTNFSMVVLADRHAGDEVQRRAVLYRVVPDLFLVEEVGAGGTHQLSFCNRRAAGEWLAVHANADPSQIAEQVDEAATADEVLAILRRLDETERHRTSIYVRESLAGTDLDTQREVAVYDTPAGTWLCEYMDVDAEPVAGGSSTTSGAGTHVRTRRTSVVPLAAYLVNFLAPVQPGDEVINNDRGIDA